MSIGTTPRPVFGKHVTLCSIAPCTVSSAGLITAGTAVDLAQISNSVPVGVLMGISFSRALMSEEINAMHTTRENMVNYGDGWSATIEIFKINNGSDPNPLYTAIQGVAGATQTDYLEIIWVVGTVAGSIATHTFLGIAGEFTDGGQGRASQKSTLALGPVDAGIVQYSVTYT
jgi:hypothetical protein